MASWLFDVLAGTALDYPTVAGDGSVDPNVDPRDSVLAKWFAPKLTQYPRPAAPSSLGGITEATIASARLRALLDALAVAGITPSPTPVASAAITAASPSVATSGAPSMASLSDALLLHLLMTMAPRDPATGAGTPVVIAPTCVPTAPASPVSAPVAVAPATPAVTTPVTPTPISPAPVVPQPAKIKTTFRAWSLNPDFAGPGISTLFDAEGEARYDDVNEDVLATLLESQSVDGDPLTFNVPDGCNAVEILAGPIETVPGAGTQEDLDLPAFTGRARVLSNGCDCSVDRLHPGDELTVIVPWRASGAISLPSGRLRQLVHVHFFKSDAPSLSGSGLAIQ